ncbi:MAG: AAA domain-containing protein [Saprospiraceae bacterium]|nr:AAA domain-containing protein [Saprospiraceae bacterium]
MKNEALAKLFYREIWKIAQNEALPLVGKVEAFYRLLQVIFIEVTKQERLQFSTLFARIAYVSHRFQFDKKLQFYIHTFRRQAEHILQNKNADEKIYELGLKVLAETILVLFETPISTDLQAIIPENWALPFRPAEVRAFRPKIRAVALADDSEHNQLIAKVEDQPEATIRIQYSLPAHNENFDPTIAAIRKVFGFPVTLNLLDVEIDTAGIYRPKAFVVEPDYLVDVSAVAECFREAQPEPFLHLLKKYLPFENTKYRLLGNIANFFLDELMHKSDWAFKELFPKVFQINPLSFCLFDNAEIREIQQTSQLHFINLKKLVQQDLTAQNIAIENCFLEPTFYSETHGLQGRLDIFFQSEEKSAIIELKSGKPFMPNAYGISGNHFAQTLLYDLLIQSTFGKGLDPASYILYSGQEERQLRFAPRVRSQQYEALQVRNHLVALEWLLLKIGQEGDLLEQGQRLFGRLRPSAFPNAKGFTQKDLAEFEALWQGMNEVERKYFTAFSGFIAREHQLAKTGVQGLESVNGQASLWLDTFERKQESFSIINHLKVKDNQANEDEPLLIFSKTEWTNPLANFRQGDIAVLYPEGDSPLAQQIFKCTIVELKPETVMVRLRSRQFNLAIFEHFEYWNLEPDLLDSSFLAMYRGLYDFAKSSPARKALLLGQMAPKWTQTLELPYNPELTEEQHRILCKLLAVPDYFLLWGPPGTGKTSVMLRYMVQYLLNNTNENILLLAYTNRAVDEMCEAIENISDSVRNEYFRIGSHYATDERFHGQLLQTKTENITNRQDLKQIIERHRIVIATVASIGTKPELLQLKSFDTVIIDEASQVLEPMLAGLLPQFKRFILIGDHKQLPAVVVQDPEASAVRDEDLKTIGLSNLRNSLFERLFKRCQQQDWHWAYAQLSHQGRMHRDIMEFPNRYFYDNTLKILPETSPNYLRQIENITFQLNGTNNTLIRKLAQSRVLFLPTEPDNSNPTQKTNRHEAEMIAELILSFQELTLATSNKQEATSIKMPDARDQMPDNSFQHISKKQQATSGKELPNVGIITPYRAQIAQIRSVLTEKDIDITNITIDTVERYQGGARDIILISLCTNSITQITSLTSLSDEGIDRKLNVALTRAREYVVVLGNPDLLKGNNIYKLLIESAL